MRLLLPFFLPRPWAFTLLLGVGVTPVWEEGEGGKREAPLSVVSQASSSLCSRAAKGTAPQQVASRGVTTRMQPPQAERWAGPRGLCHQSKPLIMYSHSRVELRVRFSFESVFPSPAWESAICSPCHRADFHSGARISAGQFSLLLPKELEGRGSQHGR